MAGQHAGFGLKRGKVNSRCGIVSVVTVGTVLSDKRLQLLLENIRSGGDFILILDSGDDFVARVGVAVWREHDGDNRQQ